MYVLFILFLCVTYCTFFQLHNSGFSYGGDRGRGFGDGGGGGGGGGGRIPHHEHHDPLSLHQALQNAVDDGQVTSYLVIFIFTSLHIAFPKKT